MGENKSSYLEKQLDAVITKDDDAYDFVFQRAKLSIDRKSTRLNSSHWE